MKQGFKIVCRNVFGRSVFRINGSEKNIRRGFFKLLYEGERFRKAVFDAVTSTVTMSPGCYNDFLPSLMQKLTRTKIKKTRDSFERAVRFIIDTDIMQVAHELGIKTKRYEKNIDYFYGKCPLCEEEEDLVFEPLTGVFHCFNCSESGNVIALVMKCKKMSYEQALDWLEKFHNKHNK